MSKGRIIFLNGASSSGKSTIAKALQGIIEEPCIHLCIDDYLGAFQKGLWDKEQVVQQRWSQIVSGFHAAAAAIARAGNLIIVDDVLEENPPWVKSLLDLFDGLEVVFVGVHCPLEELERREKKRGDRRRGMARLQFDQVHSQAIYDVNVDTSVLSPEECASAIVDHMGRAHQTSAFERLCSRYSSGESESDSGMT
jgi:chloramphenicol 3-O phosphotransferase